MKKIFLSTFILCAFVLSSKAQTLFDQNCYYGITFDSSTTPNWGYGELVITDVEPHSPADKAGIKIGDIIMEINGKATYLRDNPTIASWLFDVHEPSVEFTIRNMNTYFGSYTLQRKCVNVNSVSERELSSIFSFYSLENSSQRRFTLPLKVESNPNADFADYHTFDIIEDPDASSIDKLIFENISNTLIAKGMIRSNEDPDLVVNIYYAYDKKDGKSNAERVTWRFDSEKKEMVKLPFFEYNNPQKETQASLVMEMGITFYDRKYINEGNLTQIWDCNINASKNYSFYDYVKIHIPLMLMQFPYATNKVIGAEYLIDFIDYNYTGIGFNADDLTTVRNIDEGSPAYEAGIMVGYVIRKINNKEFGHTKKSLSEAYLNFIKDTDKYRDASTVFKNAEGYNKCMYWDQTQYSNIAKAFRNNKYQTGFSYLFNFNRYVEEKPTDKITIELWDGMQNRLFNIVPERRSSVVIKAL